MGGCGFFPGGSGGGAGAPEACAPGLTFLSTGFDALEGWINYNVAGGGCSLTGASELQSAVAGATAQCGLTSFPLDPTALDPVTVSAGMHVGKVNTGSVSWFYVSTDNGDGLGVAHGVAIGRNAAANGYRFVVNGTPGFGSGAPYVNILFEQALPDAFPDIFGAVVVVSDGADILTYLDGSLVHTRAGCSFDFGVPLINLQTTRFNPGFEAGFGRFTDFSVVGAGLADPCPSGSIFFPGLCGKC